MNVLNAVPLTTTASSKATAFSLIIRMFRFSLFCCGWGARTIRGEREGESPGLAHHIQMLAQFSISTKTENNSSSQSKKVINPDLGDELWQKRAL
ncbi:hypothetical protein [Porphyrobacter sp. TH134]|uniref:hypothetical protein n=1 Tax=Porphyrobacter sp. TH134 TaxID=2067450 RepID=UPI001180A82A|nr:hypothetical protein [Porphyrobacter sp. TH134]